MATLHEQMLYIVVIVGFKIFIDLFDAVCTLVAYILLITWAIGAIGIYLIFFALVPVINRFV